MLSIFPPQGPRRRKKLEMSLCSYSFQRALLAPAVPGDAPHFSMRSMYAIFFSAQVEQAVNWEGAGSPGQPHLSVESPDQKLTVCTNCSADNVLQCSEPPVKGNTLHNGN